MGSLNGGSPIGVSPIGGSPNGVSPIGGSPSLIGVSPNGTVHNVLFVDFGAPVYKNALCRIQRHLLWSRIIYS